MITTELRPWHALLDAARMGANMAHARAMTQQHASLYKGDSQKDLADFAPYIFSLNGGNDLVRWLLEAGWGNSWGVFLQTIAPGPVLVRHFRQFLMVTLETGEEAYFRFYDPRVLRAFLPTCNTRQLHEFFGPVQRFFLEDEDPDFGVFFWLEGEQLKRERVNKTDSSQFNFFTPLNK